MIVLDTNVVGELLRPDPSRRVVSWFRRQTEGLVLTSLTIAEIEFGIAGLPDGRRKQWLADEFEAFLAEDLTPGAILPFDEAGARAYGALYADLVRRGVRIETFDAMIAAIAIQNDCAVATRNVSHFAPTGVRVVNPWA